LSLVRNAAGQSGSLQRPPPGPVHGSLRRAWQSRLWIGRSLWRKSVHPHSSRRLGRAEV